MSLFAFDACVNFCLLSPSTGFFLFFVAQEGRPYFWCLQYIVLNTTYLALSRSLEGFEYYLSRSEPPKKWDGGSIIFPMTSKALP